MTIKEELLALKNEKGFINPHEGVEWARTHPQSELHAAIEWNDKKAAHEYRLNQFRRLVEIHVVDVAGRRQTVSLIVDRTAGGGYRDLHEVIRHPETRRMVLRQALDEFRRVRDRYHHLNELARIAQAIDETQAEFDAKAAGAAAAA